MGMGKGKGMETVSYRSCRQTDRERRVYAVERKDGPWTLIGGRVGRITKQFRQHYVPGFLASVFPVFFFSFSSVAGTVLCSTLPLDSVTIHSAANVEVLPDCTNHTFCMVLLAKTKPTN